MPRPKLSSLSSLLPAKGEATRPEQVARAANNGPNEKSMQANEQARIQDSEQTSKLTILPMSSSSGHKDGSRSAVSFRMTEGLQERLRLFAFETRRSKQDILDDALHEYLARAAR